MHVVPADTSITADHCPLAHRWKDVPPMQFHSPSVVQAVPTAIAVPVPVVPVLAGLDDEATTDAAALDAGEATGAADDATGA